MSFRTRAAAREREREGKRDRDRERIMGKWERTRDCVYSLLLLKLRNSVCISSFCKIKCSPLHRKFHFLPCRPDNLPPPTLLSDDLHPRYSLCWFHFKCVCIKDVDCWLNSQKVFLVPFCLLFHGCSIVLTDASYNPGTDDHGTLLFTVLAHEMYSTSSNLICKLTLRLNFSASFD